MALPTIESVCIPAKDLKESLDFWSQILGLKLVKEYETQMVLTDGKMELILDAEKSKEVEIILSYPSLDFFAIVEKISKSNFEIIRPLKDWGGPLGLEITVKDLSGNIICIHKVG